MSDRALVNNFMKEGEVVKLADKLMQEGIDPIAVAREISGLDKASDLKKEQKSITDGEVIAVQTYGSIEQIKARFTNKLMENGSSDNIALSDQKEKVYYMMNRDHELPLKHNPVKTSLNPALLKKSADRTK